MKILQVNKYLFRRDGVTTVIEETIRILQNHGHDVSVFGQNGPKDFTRGLQTVDIKPVYFNSKANNAALKLSALLRMFFGYGSLKPLSDFLKKTQIDIAHLHNIYHHISPLIIGLLKKRGIPVVMTLHDYKVFCPDYLFLRRFNTKGPPLACTYCLGNGPFGVLRYRCIKGSLTASFPCYLEALLGKHFYSMIDHFIAPSNFMAEKAISGGIPRSRISILKNPAPFLHEQEKAERNPGSPYPKPLVLFLGRLYPEKGAETLLRAFSHPGHDQMQLVIAGEGPEKSRLEQLARELDLDVKFPGFLTGKEKYKTISRAMVLVFPSLWYENCPMSILEALSLGKPVIASRIGGIPELIEDGENGILVRPGSITDMSQALQRLYSNLDLLKQTRVRAQERILTDFNPEIYGNSLEKLYMKLCSERVRGRAKINSHFEEQDWH